MRHNDLRLLLHTQIRPQKGIDSRKLFWNQMSPLDTVRTDAIEENQPQIVRIRTDQSENSGSKVPEQVFPVSHRLSCLSSVWIDETRV